MFTFVLFCFVFFFKQKTAYEMRISDWSSDVCSSDLRPCARRARTSVLFRFRLRHGRDHRRGLFAAMADGALDPSRAAPRSYPCLAVHGLDGVLRLPDAPDHQRRAGAEPAAGLRSEEHTSELQSLMRISYAVSCLKK